MHFFFFEKYDIHYKLKFYEFKFLEKSVVRHVTRALMKPHHPMLIFTILLSLRVSSKKKKQGYK